MTNHSSMHIVVRTGIHTLDTFRVEPLDHKLDFLRGQASGGQSFFQLFRAVGRWGRWRCWMAVGDGQRRWRRSAQSEPALKQVGVDARKRRLNGGDGGGGGGRGGGVAAAAAFLQRQVGRGLATAKSVVGASRSCRCCRCCRAALFSADGLGSLLRKGKRVNHELRNQVHRAGLEHELRRRPTNY